MSPDKPLNLYASYRSHFPSPEKILLINESGETCTYADAEERSAQIANHLVALGLVSGDRVSAQVEKSPESLWLYLGVIRAGMVFHPLNTAYTDEELRYFLQDAGTALLVCDSSRAASLRTLGTELGVAYLHTLDADGSGTLTQESAVCSGQFETAATLASDLAALVYSSGTTGQPKGIMLSHNNLVCNASVLVDQWGFTAHDCLLHALPIFHVHGLFVAIGCVLMSGASMHWLSRFDVVSVMQALPVSTVMMGVPTYYSRLLAEPAFSADTCARTRLFISGSAPLQAATFADFERRTGHAILERYGMTETGMNTSNPLHGTRRMGTVGLPLPGVTVRICDNADRELGFKEVGELQVSGPNVFAGYWNKPDKTAEDFTLDGFFRTGDQARRDEDGYITIVGRSKDMVISGGLNVYPKEVELLIDTLPGVLESAVIGVPDPDFGEIVVAIVVLESQQAISAESIRDAVKARAANYKVPKTVLFIDKLPRNAMGKVQKQLLRRDYRTLLAHQAQD